MAALLSVIMAVLYVGAAIIIKRQIPESISSMVYILPEGGWRWLWTIWLWSEGFLLIVPLTDALPDEWRIIAFLTIASLVFCGAMPLFVKEQNKWHNILGVSSGILSQLCVLIINPWYLSIWILMISALRIKNKIVFIAEAICYITILLSLKSS